MPTKKQLEEKLERLQEEYDSSSCEHLKAVEIIDVLSKIIEKKLGFSTNDIICDIGNDVYEENKRFYPDELKTDSSESENEEEECEDENDEPC